MQRRSWCCSRICFMVLARKSSKQWWDSSSKISFVLSLPCLAKLNDRFSSSYFHSFQICSQWASRRSIWLCLGQTNPVSCQIVCQKNGKSACLEPWVVPMDASPRAIFKTGLGSVVAALDAEFRANMWFGQALVLLMLGIAVFKGPLGNRFGQRFWSVRGCDSGSLMLLFLSIRCNWKDDDGKLYPAI